MEIKLENESLELTINSFGAELKSITGKETGTQYLWDADEKRTGAFPVCRQLKGQEVYR